MRRRVAEAVRAAGVPRTVAAVLAPVLFLVALLGWALASPVGASPDDDFHLASIWCQTERDGICEDSGDEATRLIPSDIVQSTCFAFRSDVSASCQGDGMSSMVGDPLVESSRGNFEDLYPPVFYWVMSLFSGQSLVTGVLVMRAVNALLFVALLSAVVVCAPRWLRVPAVVGAVATAVPLGMFLVPSINPSSWALLSASTFWVALLGLAFTRGRRALVLGALAVLAAVIGAGARADALFFLVIAALAVGALSFRRRGARWWVYAVGAVAVLVAGLLFLTASQGGQVATGLPNDVAAQRSLGDLLKTNAIGVPRLWVGMFGEWGLGWLDTPLPATTWVAVCAVVAGLAFWGLSRTDARKTLVVAGALFALWAVPLVLLVQTHALVGEHVQPRYILPLGILLVGFSLLPARGLVPRPGVVQLVALAGALTVANAGALHANIQRYVTGNEQQTLSLGFRAEWWWAAPVPGPQATWLIGSVAFAGALAALAYLWHTASPVAALPWVRPDEAAPADGPATAGSDETAAAAAGPAEVAAPGAPAPAGGGS